MAKIQIENVINHLDYEMESTLEDMLRKVLPEANVHRNLLFREFKRSIRRKCKTWENVPDRLLKTD